MSILSRFTDLMNLDSIPWEIRIGVIRNYFYKKRLQFHDLLY